jgi:hypothetical protein
VHKLNFDLLFIVELKEHAGDQKERGTRPGAVAACTITGASPALRPAKTATELH